MRALLATIPLVFLFGCSSSTAQSTSGQYCDMVSETLVVKNSQGIMEEVTVEHMKCDDNPIRRLFQVQSGMAPNCGEFTYWMQIGGRNVQRKGVSCQKPDGSWEIVNTGRN
jgi:curli biogenesis system outer membrane secretion channel CsgG